MRFAFVSERYIIIIINVYSKMDTRKGIHLLRLARIKRINIFSKQRICDSGQKAKYESCCVFMKLMGKLRL